MPIKTLSIGGATYDVFLQMDPKIEQSFTRKDIIEFAVGKKIRIEHVQETCGGGANNTAIGLQRLGCTSAFCGITASDQWGEALLKNLQKEGVDTSSATIVEGETSSFSIILQMSTGERTILYTAGVNEHLHDTTFDKEALQRTDAVYLNHLSETACMIEDDMIDMLIANTHVHLTWNPGGCQLVAGMHSRYKSDLLKRTTLLLLNKQEAELFTGTSSIQASLKTLIDSGAKNVCITDGANGTWAAHAESTYFCPTVQGATIVDTTGAGDAFGVGATWALLHGESLQEALIAGTLNATSVIGVIGAQPGLLTETQMQHARSKCSLVVESVR